MLFMRADCEVCRAEGFNANTRILLSQGELDYAADYYADNQDLFMTGEAP
ncbi:hypothetical protein [Zobellella endophytica]|nr:hypothetical protein [Zobellella endophytica]